MTMNISQRPMAVALFLTVFLSACGGGGDDAGSGVNLPPNKDDAPHETPEQPVDSPNHNDTSAALVASNTFSLARTQCGLGGLQVDSELDAIAAQHAQYIQYVYVNRTPTVFNAHYENVIDDIADVTGDSNPFFGGLSVKDRLINADYRNVNYGFTENIAHNTYYSSVDNNLAPAEVAVRSMAKSLLAAPYHLRTLMVPSSSVTGTGFVAYKPYNKAAAYNQGYVLVNNAAATQATKNKTVAGVFTYPCQGATDTATALYNETPDPVKHTGRNLRLDPIGQPVYINVPSAQSVKVSNIVFRDLKRNTVVPTELIDYDQDPYKNTPSMLAANEAFILPITDGFQSCEVTRISGQSKQCGLYGNTKYQVSFDILIDNAVLKNQSFTFTTGDVNY